METEELTRLVDEIYKVSVQSSIDLEIVHWSRQVGSQHPAWFLLIVTYDRNQP